MRQISLKVAALTAGAVLMLAAQAHAVVLHIGSAQGAPGSIVTVTVTLETEQGPLNTCVIGGAPCEADADCAEGTCNLGVAGTENLLAFPTGARIPAKTEPPSQVGTPECFVNEEIMKGLSDAFQPPDCEDTPEDPPCTGYKGIIISLEDTAAIPDGSLLYTCQWQIAADAAPGTLPIVCSEPGSSDPDGVGLDTTCTNGEITVSILDTPTETPTGPGETPTPTPTVPALVNLVVSSANGEIGGEVDITVTLDVLGLGTVVAGTENLLNFGETDGAIRIKAKEDGTPDCAVNPGIMKSLSDAFQPADCEETPEDPACTGYKGIIISLEDVAEIPDGSLLYTCKVQITEAAQDGQTYELTCANPAASDPDGIAISTSCTSGQITVGGGIPGESTLAEAITADATTIPLVDASTFPDSGTVLIGEELISYTGKDGNNLTGATRGVGDTEPAAHAAGDVVTLQQVAPTSTPTVGGPTPTRSVTQTPVCDDGCAIASPADSQTGWLLLLPAAMLVWLRRRSR